MVDTPKYKSNFVRGLEENNNRIITADKASLSSELDSQGVT